MTSKKLLITAGFLAVAIFMFLYGIELFSHHGPPATVRWIESNFGRGGLIVLNLLVVIAFLTFLPYRRPTEGIWKSKGAFIAFTIALMTEMFGWPLLIFLFSPVVEIPSLREWAHRTLGHAGPVIGTWLSMLGLLLIVLGWSKIHKATDFVTTGIYRFIRHPQYTGIFLFTFGWLLHWPTVTTLVLWPILMAAYVWLALHEEREIAEKFGERYLRYAERTPRFFPRLIPARDSG
jgi:protein-S-isoprenylcysteine O-methyltransferase Ste14